MGEDSIFQRKEGDFYAFIDLSRSFYSHFHPHIELNYMFEGEYSVTCDNKTYTAKAGDLFVIFPNQVHSFDSPKHHASFVMIVSPTIFSENSTFFEENVPFAPLIKASEMPASLKERILELRSITSASRNYLDCVESKIDFRRDIETDLRVRGILNLAFSEIIGKIDIRTASHDNLDILKQFVAYCNKNYDSELYLYDVAEKLSVSKTYLSKLISEKLGVGFNRYLNELRINEAVRRLEYTDEPIAVIAMKTGYASIRTFNRAFKDVIGVTPSEYKQAHNGI